LETHPTSASCVLGDNKIIMILIKDHKTESNIKKENSIFDNFNIIIETEERNFKSFSKKNFENFAYKLFEYFLIYGIK
jgi:hypothetical protein